MDADTAAPDTMRVGSLTTGKITTLHHGLNFTGLSHGALRRAAHKAGVAETTELAGKGQELCLSLASHTCPVAHAARTGAGKE